MITRSNLTDQLTAIYQQRLDLRPSDLDNPPDAPCGDLETVLALGILILDDIRRRHSAWFAEVESKRIAYDIEDAQSLADQYQRWIASTEFWLARVDRFVEGGCPLQYAAEIRRLYQDLQLVETDVRGLVRRWEDLDQGKGIDGREFFASLRKRHSA